jgi:hypothetical protein
VARPEEALGPSLALSPSIPVLHEVLGPLTNLPIAIRQGPPKSPLHLLTVEGRQRQDGPATDGRPVFERGKHRRQPPVVSDRPEGGDGRLPAEWIGVLARHLGQLVHREAPAGGSPPGLLVGCQRGSLLPGGPCCRLHDRRVVIVEQAEQVDSRVGSGQLAGPGSDTGRGISKRADEIGVAESSGPRQSGQGARPHPFVWVIEVGKSRGGVASVAGQHDETSPLRGRNGRGAGAATSSGGRGWCWQALRRARRACAVRRRGSRLLTWQAWTSRCPESCETTRGHRRCGGRP